MRSPSHRVPNGFTIVELMVIVLVIGVLASIAIATYPQMRVKAGNGAAISDLKNAAHFQETFYATNETYADQTTVDAEFTPTESVTLTVISADDGGYEMSASHASSDVTWCLSSADGAVVDC